VAGVTAKLGYESEIGAGEVGKLAYKMPSPLTQSSLVRQRKASSQIQYTKERVWLD
jgi:hypothetical protein